LSQTTSAQACPYVSSIFTDGAIPDQKVITFTNDTASTMIIESITYEWNNASVSLVRVDYPDGNQIWAGTNSTGSINLPLNMLLAPGASANVRVYFSGDAQGIFNAVMACPVTFPTPTPTHTATPTITPTPTVYGEPTATVTPTPTNTPRPDVESTAETMMIQAQEAVSDTLGIGEIAPYDWRASNPTLAFPDLFNEVIAPYIGPIISYALALWEIVNTNNVVAIIFIFALGIGLLVWAIKLIAGANRSGWDQTGVKRYRRNPYRWR